MATFPKLNQFEFHHILAENPGISLVIFSTRACSSCFAWKQLLGKLQQTRPEIQVFEVDAQQDMALTREFEVFHLPSLFLFNDGAYHGELQCAASPDAVEQRLQQMLAQPPQEMP